MTTVNGGTLRCTGTAKIIVSHGARRVMLSALVVQHRPIGMDLMLGMSGITAVGGVSLKTPADFRLCAVAEPAEVAPAAAVAAEPALAVDAAAAAATAAFVRGRCLLQSSIFGGEWRVDGCVEVGGSRRP